MRCKIKKIELHLPFQYKFHCFFFNNLDLVFSKKIFLKNVVVESELNIMHISHEVLGITMVPITNIKQINH